MTEITAQIQVIGIVDNDETPIQLRFLLADGEWVADIVVDKERQEVDKPPECFSPNDETLSALNKALGDWLDGLASGLSDEASRLLDGQ
jgi:hypothetical protein